VAGTDAASLMWRAVARLGSAVVLGAVAVTAYFAVPYPNDLPTRLKLGTSLLGLLLLAALMSRLVLRHFFGPVGGRVSIELLLVAILISVLLFGFAYHTVAIGRPGQFLGLHTRLDALYFSLATMSTAGSGNIYPVGQLARGLVVGQLIFDVAMVTAALSVVSGRMRTWTRRRDQAERRRRAADR
jgi:voltage-gated potassium channel